VGETPNLTARLQGIAAPNTVVVAEGTRRLPGNFFELEDLGTKDLKGIARANAGFVGFLRKPLDQDFTVSPHSRNCVG